MIQLPPEIRNEVTGAFGKGDILFWREYEFPDSDGSKDSFIIFLTECIQGRSFLIIRGTANIDRYNTDWGRKLEIFRLTPKECPMLSKETVLDFRWITEVDIEKINRGFSESSKIIGRIPQEVINKLTKKIESSKTVEQWKKILIRESKPSTI